MTTSKERFEILLEEIKADVKLSLAGQEGLRNEIRTFRGELNDKTDIVESAVKFIANKVNSIDAKLTEHINQPVHI